MYYCLAYWTGAVPAEYYSLQNRKGYQKYCDNTPNMLIPTISKIFHTNTNNIEINKNK